MSTPEAQDHARLLSEIETQIAELERIPDRSAKERARAAVRAVLELHAAGLARIQRLTAAQGKSGWDILQTCGRDPLIHSLWVLHDLHPQPFADRVAAGLEKVSTFFQLNASRVEMLSASDSTVRLRVLSDPARCRTTPERLRSAVEQSLLEAVPDAMAVEIEFLSAEESGARV